MPWNPQTQRPIWDGSQPDRQAIQQPIQVIRQAEVNPDWSPGASIQDASDQVEAYHGPSIANFVDRSRTYAERSGLDSTRTNWSTDGLTLRYEKLFGYERMFITTYPQNFNPGGQGADINYDGYIMILSYFSVESTQGSSNQLTYDFQLNGQSLGSHTFTLGKSPEAVVIKLGSTALRCWSIADDDNPKANPNKHVNVILPPRPQIKKHQNTFYWFPFLEAQGISAQIPDHSDLPIYAIYDWNSVYNSGADATGLSFDINNETITLNQMALNNIPITVITPDFSQNANPLKNRALNKFRAVCKDKITYYTGGGNIILQAEFYSRYYIRSVDQSWHTSGGNISVNDTPLYFGIRTGFSDQLPIDIDLTPQKIDRTTPTPQTAYDPYTSNSAPYINGYWRIGDAVSEYDYISPGSWSVLTVLVQEYTDFVTNLYNFFNNTLDINVKVVVTFNPENGTDPIGMDPAPPGQAPTYYWNYDVSPVFWPPDFADYGSLDPTIRPLNTALQQVVNAQYARWTANYSTAQENLKTQSVYYADNNALQMMNQLITDAAALQSIFVGADLGSVPFGSSTFPIYNVLTNPNVDGSLWWKRFGSGDNNLVFSTPLAVQVFYQAQETLFLGNQSCSMVVNTANKINLNEITNILNGIQNHKDV